jgi:hypothetical protein
VATPPNSMTAFFDTLRVHATDLTPMVANIQDLYANQLNNGYGSVYSVSQTSLAGATTFAVMTPLLSTGSGQGLSLTGNTFTVSAGFWVASFALRVTTTAAQHNQIMISSNGTAGDSGWVDGDSLQGSGALTNGSMSCSTGITSVSGTTTVSFKADARSTGATIVGSRITWMRLAPA